MSKLTLIALQGLPASGKSTLARKLAEEGGFKVVEKDQIRSDLKLQGWTWSKEKEKRDVLPIRDSQIIQALEQKISVISADTNFQPEHIKRLKELAERYEAEFILMPVPATVGECIQRDSLRPEGERVGEGVIRKMARTYLRAPQEAQIQVRVPVVPDESLIPAIICDLDGTLAHNNQGRSFYDASDCINDTLDKAIWSIIRLFHDKLFYHIIYLSGREELFRDATNKFLIQHICPPGSLLMRPTKDYRKDSVVKYEIFNSQVRGKYDVKFVLDDRDKVVEMWREIGLKCLQAQDGDY